MTAAWVNEEDDVLLENFQREPVLWTMVLPMCNDRLDKLNEASDTLSDPLSMPGA
jgi:hypothetical protein